MTLNKISRFWLLIVSVILITTACKKTPDPKPMGDAGQTLVKFYEGGTPADPGVSAEPSVIERDPNPVTITVADLRRDISSEAELVKPMSVTLRVDPSAVAAADPDLVPLPVSSFSVEGATASGSDFTVTFAPGEFAKQIKIVINDVLSLDFTRIYGVGLSIVSTTAEGKVLAERMSYVGVVSIDFVNAYDGIYELRGFIYRNVPPVDATSTGSVGPKEITLKTTGVYAVKYQQTHGWANTATIGIAATIATPTYTVDPNTNLVTVTSDGGPFPDGLKNEPSLGISRYDPGTKTFYVYGTWAGGVTSRYMSDTLVYLRPR